MMFPSAVQGHMPFADKYKQEQLKKAVQKRARHHSGPDKSKAEKAANNKNVHSMPILWQSVYSGPQPRFRSLPTLAHKASADPKSSKSSLLSSLKNFFMGKKELPSSPSLSVPDGVNRQNARPSSTQTAIKKPADNHDAQSGGRSPKRQRVRTISNISSVMETIEELNEALVSTDHLSDYSDSSSDSDCSLTSASDLRKGYQCSNSNRSTSRESSRHSSSEVLCGVY